MTDAQVWSILEERGFRRDYITNHIDRGYANRIIGYPRDEKGRIEEQDKETPYHEKFQGPRHPHADIIDRLRALGWHNWRIHDYIKEMEEQQRIAALDAMRQSQQQQQSIYGPNPLMMEDGAPIDQSYRNPHSSNGHNEHPR